MPNAQLAERLKSIRLLCMDVDGVLTDGSIAWAAASDGSLLELKQFNVKDGLGLGLARAVGLEIAWITGRRSALVERRAAELDVRELAQGARDKRRVLKHLSLHLGYSQSEVLYIGDDINDLPAFEAAGVRVAVADAAVSVRERADWVTQTPGGRGAVREVVEELLQAQGRWESAVRGFLARLEHEQETGAVGTPPLQ